MKILHTSDLHLGHTLYSYDRTVEQTGCLAQIENIIKEQKPDAYVISGDVYHTTSPQTSAQEMFMHHLMTVHEIAPSMKVIVTAGNHDSNKIEITDPLWNLVGVSIVASINATSSRAKTAMNFTTSFLNAISSLSEKTAAPSATLSPYLTVTQAISRP